MSMLKMENGGLSENEEEIDEEDSIEASMVLKQWSDDALEELICAYEPHKCLWVTTSEEYKDQDKKEMAFQKVDRAMQKYHFTRLEYTKKWTILRGQFLREVRRERSSNHKTGWRWYYKLEFLKKDEVLFDKRVKSKTETINSYSSLPRKRSHAAVEVVPSLPVVTPHQPQNKQRRHLEIAVSPHQQPKQKHLQQQQKHSQQQQHQQQQQHHHIVHQNSHEDIVIEYVNPPFISAERKDDPSSSRRVKNTGQPNNNKTSISSCEAEDQESLFGKMVATTIRKFNPYQRVLVRKQIQDLLFDIELQNASNST